MTVKDWLDKPIRKGSEWTPNYAIPVFIGLVFGPPFGFFWLTLHKSKPLMIAQTVAVIISAIWAMFLMFREGTKRHEAYIRQQTAMCKAGPITCCTNGTKEKVNGKSNF